MSPDLLHIHVFSFSIVSAGDKEEAEYDVCTLNYCENMSCPPYIYIYVVYCYKKNNIYDINTTKSAKRDLHVHIYYC
jgi:hypothetical protein